MTEPLLKTRDVARNLGVEMATVLDWCQQGKLPFLRVGHRGAYRFRQTEIDAWLETWRGGTPPTETRKPTVLQRVL